MRKKGSWVFASKYPAGILSRGIEVLNYLIEVLRKFRSASEQYSAKFESEGFRNLFAMLEAELTDEYFASVKAHLKEMKFRAGVLISANLGKGNKGTNYVLRKSRTKQHWLISWLQQYFGISESGYTFVLDPRDENGARALSEMNDRGINLIQSDQSGYLPECVRPLPRST
jgi:hypothetical protein